GRQALVQQSAATQGAQKAANLRERQDESDGVHPRFARVLYRYEVDGKEERGDGGDRRGVGRLVRGQWRIHSGVRQREYRADQEKDERNRERGNDRGQSAHRRKAIAKKSDPGVKKQVVNAQFAGIQAGLALQHLSDVLRRSGGPTGGFVGREIGRAQVRKTQPGTDNEGSAEDRRRLEARAPATQCAGTVRGPCAVGVRGGSQRCVAPEFASASWNWDCSRAGGDGAEPRRCRSPASKSASPRELRARFRGRLR